MILSGALAVWAWCSATRCPARRTAAGAPPVPPLNRTISEKSLGSVLFRNIPGRGVQCLHANCCDKASQYDTRQANHHGEKPRRTPLWR
jgi:hypothetical protein